MEIIIKGIGAKTTVSELIIKCLMDNNFHLILPKESSVNEDYTIYVEPIRRDQWKENSI